MKKASRKQLLAEAAKHGITENDITWTDYGDGDNVEVFAPEGKRWGSDQIHSYIGWRGYGNTIPIGEVYADLIYLIQSGGLEDCPSDCTCKEVPPWEQ